MRCRLSLMFLLVLAPLAVPLCSAISAEEQQAAIGDINALLRAAEGGDLKTMQALIGKGGVNAEDEKQLVP